MNKVLDIGNRSYMDVVNPNLVPEETDTYKPMPNDLLIERIRNVLFDNDYVITDEQYRMNRSETQLFGVFRIKGFDVDMWNQVAVVNSYDKQRALGIATGIGVEKCSNLAFSDFKSLRRHTKHMMKDFEEILQNMVESLDGLIDSKRETMDFLRGVPLRDDDVPHLLGEAYYTDLINNTQLNIIKSNIKGGDYVFEANNYNDFYMHMTEALKKSHPRTIVEDHMKAEEWIIDKAEEVDAGFAIN